MTSRNPFIIGRPVTRADFYGREYELGLLQNSLPIGNHFMVTGPRKIGKTSLLLTVGNLLTERGDCSVAFLDCQVLSEPEDLLRKLTAEVAQLHGIHVPSGTSPQRGFLKVVDAAERGPHTIIVLDELDALARFPYSNLMTSLGTLRAALSTRRNISALVAVFRPPDFDVNSMGSPLFNIFQILKLSGFSEETTVSFVVSRFRNLRIPCEAAFAKSIHEVTAGYPFLVQRLCAGAYEAFREGAVNELTGGFAERLVSDQLELLVGYDVAHLSLAHKLAAHVVASSTRPVSQRAVAKSFSSYTSALPVAVREDLDLDQSRVAELLADLAAHGVIRRHDRDHLIAHSLFRNYILSAFDPSELLPEGEPSFSTSLSAARFPLNEWAPVRLSLDTNTPLPVTLKNFEISIDVDHRPTRNSPLPTRLERNIAVHLELRSSETRSANLGLSFSYEYLGLKGSFSVSHDVEFYPADRHFSPVSSPYIFGVPIQDPSRFVGRDKLVARVMSLLKVSNSDGDWAKRDVALIGRRRIGKTSLLYRLSQDSPEAGFLPIMINLEDVEPRTIESLEGFIMIKCIDMLRSAVRAHRRGRLAFVMLQIFRIFRHLRPKYSAKGVSIEYSKNEKGGRPFKRDLVAILRLLTRHFPGVRLLLMFDEATLLRSFESDHVLSYLRGIIQSDDFRRINFVIVGTDLLHSLTSQESSPLYNLFVTVRVGALSESEARHLVTQPVQGLGISYSAEAVARIVNAAGAIPYWIQALCHYTLEVLNERTKLDVQERDVETAINRLLHHQDLSLLEIWNDLNSSERLLVAVLCESSTKSLVQSIVRSCKAAGVDTTPTAVKEWLGRLAATGLVDERDDYYSMADPILEAWVRKNKSAGDLALALRPSSDGGGRNE